MYAGNTNHTYHSCFWPKQNEMLSKMQTIKCQDEIMFADEDHTNGN